MKIFSRIQVMYYIIDKYPTSGYKRIVICRQRGVVSKSNPSFYWWINLLKKLRKLEFRNYLIYIDYIYFRKKTMFILGEFLLSFGIK